MRKLFNQRVRLVLYFENSDLDRLGTIARSSGQSLIEWARAKLLSNPESAGENGDAIHQNVLRAPEANSSGRRTVAGGRGTKRITARANPPQNPARVVASDVEPAAGSVTRENFAEVAASIPKDEIDVWARTFVRREVLPGHSATSHRHTCLCTFCLEWRKANYIPYGGPVKKEKAKRE
jgi:hypothetical protein